ncbi:cysteine-rich CWC family protein [Taibaiella lutea]|uniref:Cysteine-rich CWC family protein n=1 Tax=Taibaiella lutea TaxID=2608001 RepID=A0A5M6CSY5_9BACT|nr:cysteine-rich CWC family protein [Taibaiella lutea]
MLPVNILLLYLPSEQTPMQSSFTKQCPRCHKGFICNPSNIAACQCSGISFTEAEKKFIAKQNYHDCLCIHCLKELKQIAEEQKGD